MEQHAICLRGVRVHNLQGIDLDLPRGRSIVVCGVSGSGKTSLALDTLYAEGQRRYIESISAYTRQYLERLEKPDADQIDGIPPAIQVALGQTSRSSRTTIGAATDTIDYLRLLLAKIGRVRCLKCGAEVRRETPQAAAERLAALPAGTRYMVAFEVPVENGVPLSESLSQLAREGVVRAIVDGRVVRTDDAAAVQVAPPAYAVLDRLAAGSADLPRVRESLETACDRGEGTWHVFVAAEAWHDRRESEPQPVVAIDGQQWVRLSFSRQRICGACQVEYPDPDPRLLSFNSPLGACPQCEGFGDIIDIDMDLVVPDKKKSIRQGAIAPWNTPAYSHELEELLALAPAHGIPVDVPFAELSDDEQQLIREGVPKRKFGGLRGFFAWLERRKYKMHLRVFLSRWRSYRQCPLCRGTRLRAEALCVELGGRNIADICRMPVAEAIRFFSELDLNPWEQSVARVLLEQVLSRLRYLDEVGLPYLTLDRTLRTLSRGERQRVLLTSALGSSLVNMLYVLDEPSAGLHPADVERLVGIVARLRDRANTVVIVEHEPDLIRAADEVVEMGPGAGEHGGKIVFQGTPAEMIRSKQSPTGEWLSGRRGAVSASSRRPTEHGWIRLLGARGNNLKDVTVEFPLGVLCVVTGLSGSGKTTLVMETFVPALSTRMRKETTRGLPCDDLFGAGQIDDLAVIDQSPMGRSSRSNPVTYIKAFDEIRTAFAETLDARMHNFGPSHFSFNVEGGRCEACRGEGQITIDMQFLADIFVRCSQCQGRRYRPEILQVRYRGLNISEVLDLTVREAFTLFRGHLKVQARLKQLIDVGLDYLRLGQPASTLSVGEAQRIKLAAYLSSRRKGRTLFVLDEPTTGLHFSDIVHLLDCFDALLAVGHSLIVIEHNLQLMAAADYLIDLGPGAADAGGQVIAQGPPEEIARQEDSATGRRLAALLTKSRGKVAR